MARLTPITSALVAFLFILQGPASAQPANTSNLDQSLRDAMALWKCPGLAVVVVHDDRVVYLRGLGVRELGKKDPVTPETIFPLASCTKTFTTLLLGMLVEDGRVAWDDCVRKHLSWFQPNDPILNSQVTLRDLLCHRTGIAAHDPLWYRSPWSLKERVERTLKISPTLAYRQDFQYQTVLFSASGLVAAAAANKPWDELINERILQPLEMKSTSCIAPRNVDQNLASPHRRLKDGSIARIAGYDLSQPDPAGSLHSNVRDLAKFLQFQLSDGVWNGKRLISSQNLSEPHQPQVVLRMEGAVKTLNPETLFLNYGLGWIVQDYRGKVVVMHGGTIDGFRAHLTLVPRERLGIALLNNLDRNLLNLALSQLLVDHFTGMEARDWPAYYYKMQREEYQLAKEQSDLVEKFRREAPPPTRALTWYTGTYSDEAYGTCEVRLEANRLHFSWANLKTPLDPLRPDTFLGSVPPLEDAVFAFQGEGKASAQTLRVMDRPFQKVK